MDSAFNAAYLCMTLEPMIIDITLRIKCHPGYDKKNHLRSPFNLSYLVKASGNIKISLGMGVKFWGAAAKVERTLIC